MQNFSVKSDAICLWIKYAYISDAAAHLSLNAASISLEINIRGHLSCASLSDRLCCEKSAESDFSTSLLYKTSLLAWYFMHFANITSWSWYFVIFSKQSLEKKFRSKDRAFSIGLNPTQIQRKTLIYGIMNHDFYVKAKYTQQRSYKILGIIKPFIIESVLKNKYRHVYISVTSMNSTFLFIVLLYNF